MRLDVGTDQPCACPFANLQLSFVVVPITLQNDTRDWDYSFVWGRR